jgi:hypothetical protein
MVSMFLPMWVIIQSVEDNLSSLEPICTAVCTSAFPILANSSSLQTMDGGNISQGRAELLRK